PDARLHVGERILARRDQGEQQRDLAVELERRAAQAQPDLERRAERDGDVAGVVDRRADAEPQRDEHRVALADERRDQVGEVAVAGAAAEAGEAEQDVEAGARAEADLHVEPGGLTEEQANPEVGARRGRPRREHDPEDEGRWQELAHSSRVARPSGMQVAPGFAYGGTSGDIQRTATDRSHARDGSKRRHRASSGIHLCAGSRPSACARRRDRNRVQVAAIARRSTGTYDAPGAGMDLLAWLI